MKLTESKLQELVLEELELMVENGELDEGFLDRLKARAAGAGERIKGTTKTLATKAASALAGAAGEVASSDILSKQADDTKRKTDSSVSDRRALSILRSYSKKMAKINGAIGKISDELMKDLEKLGMDRKDTRQLEKDIGTLMNQIVSLTQNLKKGKTGLSSTDAEKRREMS